MSNFFGGLFMRHTPLSLDFSKIDIKAGDTIKNYSELCAKLGLKPTSSKNKVNQINKLRAFMDFEQKGQKFYIKEIYSNPHEDFNIDSHDYFKSVYRIILIQLYLNEDHKDKSCRFSKTAFLRFCGFFNQRYNIAVKNHYLLHEDSTKSTHIEKIMAKIEEHLKSSKCPKEVIEYCKKHFYNFDFGRYTTFDNFYQDIPPKLKSNLSDAFLLALYNDFANIEKRIKLKSNNHDTLYNNFLEDCRMALEDICKRCLSYFESSKIQYRSYKVLIFDNEKKIATSEQLDIIQQIESDVAKEMGYASVSDISHWSYPTFRLKVNKYLKEKIGADYYYTEYQFYSTIPVDDLVEQFFVGKVIDDIDKIIEELDDVDEDDDFSDLYENNREMLKDYLYTLRCEVNEQFIGRLRNKCEANIKKYLDGDFYNQDYLEDDLTANDPIPKIGFGKGIANEIKLRHIEVMKQAYERMINELIRFESKFEYDIYENDKYSYSAIEKQINLQEEQDAPTE